MKPQFLKNKIQYSLVSKKGRELKTYTLFAKVFTKSKIPYYSELNPKTPILGPVFGMTVSGKIGNAITRNLLKRRTREILRAIIKKDKISENKLEDLAISLYFRKSAASVSFKDLEKDINKIISQATNK
jgi:ribonuclease P protein component